MPEPDTASTILLSLVETLSDSLRDNTSEHGFAEIVRGSKSISFYEALNVGSGSVSQNSIESTLQLEIVSLLEQAKLCCQAPLTPIISVLGLLNAGKSSLVAAFLSDENRRRVLVGSANSEGTHRFVLWVPEDWRSQPAFWNFIQNRLLHLFGFEPELLSNDPAKATLQYNDTQTRYVPSENGQVTTYSTLEIPLIATDPNLNRWGIAIMDCPDVQTGLIPEATEPKVTNATKITIGQESASQLFHERTQSIADSRQRVLARASHLCSAFVIVLPANAMHDETVSRLMRLLQQQMPNIQQILAVNRVPRKYTTASIRDELGKLYGHASLQRTYMAYSFEGPLDRERIPRPPLEYSEPADQPLPLFFRIDAAKMIQPPQVVPEADWLLRIGSQLDKKSLVDDVLRATLMQLKVRIQEGILFCDSKMRQSQNAIDGLRRTIASACLDFSTDGSSTHRDHSLRLLASKQIIEQISKSLERTAPWWAMPGRWTTRIAEASKASIAKSTRWMQWPTWFAGRTESIGRWIQSRWTSGSSGQIVTADTLVDFLRRHDMDGYLKLDWEDIRDPTGSVQSARIRSACQRAIERFQSESRIELDDRELDSLTSKMWAEMPWTKRLAAGFAPAGILFAPLIAVLMVPLDFGGSAVLVFASLKELLFAGVAGVGLIMASANAMPKIAESEAAWQQFGDLVAVLCDELGLDRPSPSESPMVRLGTTQRMVPDSRIPKPTIPNTEDQELMPEIPIAWRIRYGAKESIQSLLARVNDVQIEMR